MKFSTDIIFTFPRETKVYEKLCCPSLDVLQFRYSEDDGQRIRSEGSCRDHNYLRTGHSQSIPIGIQTSWHPRQGFHPHVNAVFVEKDDRNCWGLGFSKKSSVHHTFCCKDSSQREKLYSDSVRKYFKESSFC